MASLSDSKGKLDDGVKTASKRPILLKLEEHIKQCLEGLSQEKDVQTAELEKKIENLQVESTSGKNQLTRQPSKNCNENNFRPSTGKPDHDDSGLTTSTDSLSNHSTGSRGSSAADFVFVSSDSSRSPTPFREGNSLNVNEIIPYSELALSLKQLTEEHEKLLAQNAELHLHLGSIMERSPNGITSKILSESRLSNCDTDFESDQRGKGDAKEFCKEEGLRLRDDDNFLERVNSIEMLTDIFEQKFQKAIYFDTYAKKLYFKPTAKVLATIWYLTNKYYKGIDTEFDRNEMFIHLTNYTITQCMNFHFFYNLYNTSIMPNLLAYVKVPANKEDYIRKLSNITEGLINLYLGLCFSFRKAFSRSSKVVLDCDELPDLCSWPNLIFQQNVMNLIVEDSPHKGFGSDKCDILKSYLESCYIPMEKDDTIVSWRDLKRKYKISPIINLFNIKSLQN